MSRRDRGDTSQSNLSFRELEALARARLARFFPLFHPWVAAKQSFGLESAAQIWIDLQERTRDGKPHCTGLTGRAATTGVD